jgi:hypothetical protein
MEAGEMVTITQTLTADQIETVGIALDPPREIIVRSAADDDVMPVFEDSEDELEVRAPVRAHLDHGTDDLPAEVDRFRQLGAEAIGPGRGWFALRDPLGVAFCVTENSPHGTLERDLG